MEKVKLNATSSFILETNDNQRILITSESENIPFGTQHKVVAHFFCLHKEIPLFDENHELFYKSSTIECNERIDLSKFTSIYSFNMRGPREEVFVFTERKENEILLDPKNSVDKDLSEDAVLYNELKASMEDNHKFREFLIGEGKRMIGA